MRNTIFNHKKIYSLILISIICTSFSLNVVSSDWNLEYFLKKYSDEHFDLSKNSDEDMTVEEFIAIIYAYSYYGDGISKEPVEDKNGNLPSDWCSKYIAAEISKGTIIPSEISYKDKVDISFAAEFLSRSKGKYAYDFNNFYNFKNIENLSVERKMFLNVAVDNNLISYKDGMDVKKTIKRKDARKYEIPSGQVSMKNEMKANTYGMKELHSYFSNYYNDLEQAKKQLDELKECSNDITMVTFSSGYINSYNVNTDYKWIGCDIKYPEAIEYCNSTNKLALLGISNADNNSFNPDVVSSMLSSDESIKTCINEIIQEINKYNMDGVNISLEHLYDSDINKLSNFIMLLSDALHKEGKILMTTVGAYHNTNDENNSCYNYNIIGKYSDYVHVILYDDNPDTNYSNTGKIGPISNFVRIGRVMRYASTSMPSDKLFLGIGVFAIDYNITKKTAEDITYKKMESLHDKYKSKIITDPDTNGTYFTYRSDNDEHKVYYESNESIINRANLTYQYNLCGISTYYIGAQNINGLKLISDISNYKSEIMDAFKENLVPINLRNNYSEFITREKFCELIVKFIEAYSDQSISSYISNKNISVNENIFKDTHNPNIYNIATLKIVNGVGDNYFNPDSFIKRQEAATILMRIAKEFELEPNTNEINFEDIENIPNWAIDGIKFVSSCKDLKTNNRVMNGISKNNFSPNGQYTHEQSIMTLIRLYNAYK
jgi:spore germination protein YaaH